MSRSRWLALTLATAALGGAIASTLRMTTQVHVSTAAVTTGSIVRRVVAAGTLQPVTTVEIGTQVSGIVQWLGADYNSEVHAGEIVARLDPSSYQAALGEAEAALDQARAQVVGFQAAVDDAQTKLTRTEALAARQLVPLSDLDAARIALNEAVADLRGGESAEAEAKAAVDQAQVSLDHTCIRTPIDGLVIERNVVVGQTLAAAMQSPVLFRIAADLTRMQVHVDVDEADVGDLTAGRTATFEVESYPGETFRGSVAQVRLQPVADVTAAATTGALAASSLPADTTAAAVVSYTVIVDVPNPDERLRPGMTALVRLTGARRDGTIRLPNGALAYRPSLEVLKALGQQQRVEPPGVAEGKGGIDAEPAEVWKFDGQQLTPAPVHAGLSDDQWTELLEGDVHPGEELVTAVQLQRR
jgi:HlyD family secretion protein